MWTQPQSVVDLFSSVPLDPDYNQTIFFNSAPPDNDTVSTQLNFFRSAFPYATWNNVSYIKPTSRSVRLELQPGQTFEIIRNFNYMRFCNYDSNRTYYDGDANDSHKSYYAFVDFIEYINEKTIEVNFTIDPIQTYMFNYTLNQCFIERQHSSTDDVGDNLVAESFDLGNDYIINSHAEQISTANRVCILINRVNNRDTTEQTETVNLDGQTQVFVLSTSFTQIISISTDGDPSTILGWDYDAQTKTLTFYQVPDGTRLTVVGLVNLIPTTESKLHSGVFTPIVTATYPCVTLQDAQTIDDYLNEYNENDIICIYQYPDFLGTPDNEGATIIHLDLPTDLDGYHFKNNKLLTYPYCYIQGSNHSGGLATYNWELFNELEYTESGVTHDGVSFSIDGSIIGIPQAAMVPLDYFLRPFR